MLKTIPINKVNLNIEMPFNCGSMFYLQTSFYLINVYLVAVLVTWIRQFHEVGTKEESVGVALLV
jgi:hypothetical protein